MSSRRVTLRLTEEWNKCPDPRTPPAVAHLLIITPDKLNNSTFVLNQHDTETMLYQSTLWCGKPFKCGISCCARG